MKLGKKKKDEKKKTPHKENEKTSHTLGENIFNGQTW